MNSMTPSQWLDIAVLAVAFIAAISGWRAGALGSMLSFGGVLLGATAGVLLAPHIVSQISAPRAKLFAALFLILALVVVGEVAGVVLGRAVRGAIRNRPIRLIDSVIGVGVQLVVVLTAAWLLAMPLTQSKEQPELAAAVKGSRVLARVNEAAPTWLKTVPKRLSALLTTSGLPAVLEPFSRTPVIPVASPDPALVNNPVVAATEPSVVKIRSLAPRCQKVLEGTGFVISPDRVMTNAHVVAGSNNVTVYAGDKPFEATVVSYDPSVDVAILAVPTCRRRRWSSLRSRRKPVPTLWCWVIPAAAISLPHPPGFARPSDSVAPIFTGTRSRLPATCTPSEPMWSKVIRVGP